MSDRHDVVQRNIEAGRDVIGVQNNYGSAPQAKDMLPRLPPNFTGRESDLSRILDVLDPTTARSDRGAVISTLSGMGGVGKTALATVAGHEAINRGWFSRVLFLDLHGYTPGADPLSGEKAVEALLRAMGIPAQHIPQALEECSALYRSQLNEIAEKEGAPVLVLADNAANQDQVEPLLPGACNNRLLVTSRNQMSTLHGSRHLNLGTLTVEESVQLLRDMLLHEGAPDERIEDKQGLTKVAELCGYLPLALRICAALMQSPRRPTPSQLAEQLADQRLEGLDDGRDTVYKAFDLSYRQLSDEEASVFVLLSLTPGPDVGIDVAAALAEMSTSKVAKILDQLTAAHLTTYKSDTGRWSMHDLIAEYARHRLNHEIELRRSAKSEYSRAEKRLLAHYTRTSLAAHVHLRSYSGGGSNGFFIGRAQAVKWLDAERPGLINSVDLAYKRGLLEPTMILTLALGEYLHQGRYFDELISISRIAEKAASRAGDRYRAALVQNNLGLALRESRFFEEAIDTHFSALEVFRSEGDWQQEASTWHNLGLVWAELRRFQEAVEAYQHDLEYCQSVDDRYGEAVTRASMGIAFMELRKFDEAIDSHERAQEIFSDECDTARELEQWSHLGLALAERGRYEDAACAHERALGLRHEVSDRHRVASALSRSGLFYGDMGKFERAIGAHKEALNLFNLEGDRHREATSWANLGMVFAQTDRLHESIKANDFAVDAFRDLGDFHGQAMVRDNRGGAYLKMDVHDKAIEDHTFACEMFNRTNDPHKEAKARRNLGVAFEAAGDHENACASLSSSVELFRGVADYQLEADTLSVLGSVLSESNRRNEAITAHVRSREVFQQIGDRCGEAKQRYHIGQEWMALGKFADSLDEHTQARELYQQLGDRRSEAGELLQIGTAMAALGRVQESIEVQVHAREMFRYLREPQLEMMAWNNVGVSLEYNQRLKESANAFIESIKMSRDLNIENDVALDNLNRVLRKRGQQGSIQWFLVLSQRGYLRFWLRIIG